MLDNVSSEQQRWRILEAQRAGTLQRLIMGGMSRERAERWLAGLERACVEDLDAEQHSGAFWDRAWRWVTEAEAAGQKPPTVEGLTARRGRA